MLLNSMAQMIGWLMGAELWVLAHAVPCALSLALARAWRRWRPAGPDPRASIHHLDDEPLDPTGITRRQLRMPRGRPSSFPQPPAREDADRIGSL